MTKHLKVNRTTAKPKDGEVVPENAPSLHIKLGTTALDLERIVDSDFLRASLCQEDGMIYEIQIKILELHVKRGGKLTVTFSTRDWLLPPGLRHVAAFTGEFHIFEDELMLLSKKLSVLFEE